MHDIQLKLNEKQQGSFFILDGQQELAQMVISIDDNHLTVYHTEVAPQSQGQSIVCYWKQ